MVARYDFGTPAYDEAVALRDAVLRRPLGRRIADDDDLAAEVEQVHFGYFDGGRLVGTASLQETEGGSVLKMRQVAVDPAVRGRGVGRVLVEACEAYAKTRHAARLYCHARAVARVFYERCGWRVEGDGFEEVGLPHFVMVSAAVAATDAPSAGTG